MCAYSKTANLRVLQQAFVQIDRSCVIYTNSK